MYMFRDDTGIRHAGIGDAGARDTSPTVEPVNLRSWEIRSRPGGV